MVELKTYDEDIILISLLQGKKEKYVKDNYNT